MNTEYQTQRLLLKIITPDYLREVLDFQIKNKDNFEKYEPTRPEDFYTFSYQHSVLKCEYKLALKQSTVRFYVFQKENPRNIIGTVCLHDITRGAYSCCEIGYKFDSTHLHQGYAREAVFQAIQIAFYDLKLHRVFARVALDNTPSLHLLRSIGFLEEGIEHSSILIQGKWVDHLRFALIKPEG